MDEAILKGCDLVLSHHPLLFHPLRTIRGTTFQERVVEKAIRHSVAIYSSHTSLDTWLHGVSGRMAEKLGIMDYRILVPTQSATVGLGVVGDLPVALPTEVFLARVKHAFGVSAVRYTPWEGEVRRVAFGGGACGSYLEEAIAAGADAFVSAEFHHHELLQGAGRILLADIGHYESEQYSKELFAELLSESGVAVHLSATECSPIRAF